MNEGPILIQIWQVDPVQIGAGVHSLRGMFFRAATDPGFVSARILASLERNSLAAIVEMRAVGTAGALSTARRARNAPSPAR
jgi:hypothetical protein